MEQEIALAVIIILEKRTKISTNMSNCNCLLVEYNGYGRMNKTQFSVCVDIIMEYLHKYEKYKAKYLQLKNDGVQKGATKIKLTNTYIPKNKLTNKDKIYSIRVTGGQPFKVIINDSGIDISGHICYDRQANEMLETQFGRMPNFMGYWSSGNSILVKLTPKDYLFIGELIYIFESEGEILDFISPIKSNDIPCPIAYDKTNIYFMLEQSYDKIANFKTKLSIENAEKIYSEFYGLIGDVKHKGIKMEKIKKIASSFDINYGTC